jgi:hypothetical protein
LNFFPFQTYSAKSGCKNRDIPNKTPKILKRITVFFCHNLKKKHPWATDAVGLFIIHALIAVS